MAQLLAHGQATLRMDSAQVDGFASWVRTDLSVTGIGSPGWGRLFSLRPVGRILHDHDRVIVKEVSAFATQSRLNPVHRCQQDVHLPGFDFLNGSRTQVCCPRQLLLCQILGASQRSHAFSKSNKNRQHPRNLSHQVRMKTRLIRSRINSYKPFNTIYWFVKNVFISRFLLCNCKNSP